MNSAVESESECKRAQSLLKRIRELEEICAASRPILSSEIPAGYTPARWQLALQSFNARLPQFKRIILPNAEETLDSAKSTEYGESTESTEFDIEMGPEWELKCAQKELEKVLNQDE